MLGLLDEIGLTRLPHYTVLRTWFARIPTTTWRAYLAASAEQDHKPAEYDHNALIDRYRYNRHSHQAHARLRRACAKLAGVPDDPQSHRLQSPPERETSVKSTGVYRSYRAKIFYIVEKNQSGPTAQTAVDFERNYEVVLNHVHKVQDVSESGKA